jgi:hypothetical protein
MESNSSNTYELISPKVLFEGRSYADLQEEFWKWIFSIDCDRTNIGDVVFLRGVPLPDKPGDKFMSKPVVMVDENKLVISTDQAVFFCCYTTLSENESMGTLSSDTEHARRNDVVLALNRAGIPSDKQIFIDGNKINLGEHEMADFRVVTNEFILNVPDPANGTTLGPYFETQLSPGDHPSVAGGYCFLIKFKNAGTHYVHSIGKGVEWQGGEYVTELFYEFQVIDSNRGAVPLGMLKSFTEGRVKTSLMKLQREKDPLSFQEGKKVSELPAYQFLVKLDDWKN